MRAFLAITLALSLALSASAAKKRGPGGELPPPPLGGFKPAIRGAFNSSGETASLKCVGDPTCTAMCGYGVYDGGTEEQCITGTGSPLSVTQASGATYEGTPFEATDGGSYLGSRNSNNHTSGALGDLLSTLYAGPHTIVLIGASPSSGTVGVLHGGGFGVSGFYLQQDAAGATCVWNNSGATPTFINPNAVLSGNHATSWRFSACRRTGNSYSAWANGVAGTPSTWANTALIPAGGTVANLKDAPLWRVYIFNAFKSDAELAAMFAATFGSFTNRGVVSDTRATPAWAALPDGFIYAFGDNAPRVNPRVGLLSSPGATNAVSNSLSLCSQTITGTGTCTANYNPGANKDPWSHYAGQSTFSLLNDNDGAAQYTLTGASPGSTAGAYTAAIMFRLGSLQTGILRLTQNGVNIAVCTASVPSSPSSATFTNTGSGTALGGGVYCADGKLCSVGSGVYFGDSTSGLVRIVCRATTATSGFSVVPSWSVGLTGTDTGSEIVSDMEAFAGDYESPPFCPAPSAASQTCNPDYSTVVTTGWPTTSGEVAFDYTPQTSQPAVSLRLLDSLTSNLNGIRIIHAATNVIQCQYASPTVLDAANSSPLSWTVGQTYHMRMTWAANGTGTNAFCYRDGVQIAGNSSANLVVTGHSTVAGLGNNQSVGGSTNANAGIKNFCVGGSGRCP